MSIEMEALTGTPPTQTKQAGGGKPGIVDHLSLTVTGAGHGLHKVWELWRFLRIQEKTGTRER